MRESSENINCITVPSNTGQYNDMKIITANARSLPRKMISLLDNFSKLGLHAAMLTETWFRDNKILEKELKDINDRDGIKILAKNRRSRGGGVAIAYSPEKLTLEVHPIPGNKFEMICAKGHINGTKQAVVLVSIYIPPKQNVKTTADMSECLADELCRLQLSLHNPIFIIAGDTNRKKIGEDLLLTSRRPRPPQRGATPGWMFFSQIKMIVPPLKSYHHWSPKTGREAIITS